MSTRPAPPPEAAALKAGLSRSGLTAKQAALESGLSDARWRQIVSGYQSVGGVPVPVKAPTETLARMALTVGVTPDELREAGRHDAADELARLRPARPQGPGLEATRPTINAVATLLAGLPPEAQDEVLRLIGREVPDRPGQDNGREHWKHTA